MNLPLEEAALFFKLYPALLVYANQHLGIVEGLETPEQFKSCSMADRIKIRDALYSQPALLDSFIAENPPGFSADELTIVQSWKHFVAGDFFIFRHLKRYTVFLDTGKRPRAYGVLGLTDELEDMLPMPVPIHVHTVLLPFRDKIIYDGLLTYSRIYFGGGIRADLNEAYRTAKETEGIIETLVITGEGKAVPQAREKRPRKPPPDFRPTLESIVAEVELLRGPQLPIQSGAFSVLRAAAKLAQAAVADPENADELSGLVRKTKTALTRLEGTIYRRFYRE